jgi:predicted enzyme related to lactoylglutathione lyase
MNKTIIHFEIPAGNIEKLREFYENLFGWKFIHSPIPDMDYWLIHTVPTDEEGMPLEQGLNGGMYKKENEQQRPTNWISVPNIDEYISRLKELGGTLIVEKTEIPGVGLTAIGLDPENNHVAMLEPKMGPIKI